MRNWLVFMLLLGGLVACAPAATETQDVLHVVATTTLVGDVAAQVGGDWAQVDVLLPPGADPHAFEPRPQDVARVAEADLVLVNGFGLEAFLSTLLQNAAAEARVVEVSAGVPGRQLTTEDAHSGLDPHVWTDPNNVIVWTENIATAFAQADPAHAAAYRQNAEAYIAELRALDEWIADAVGQIPPERRLLVSDHLAWGYFADRYGFTQVGALVGAFSSNAAPSAREIAALEDDIRKTGAVAIFISVHANDALAQQIAADTGVRVVPLYTGSLTDASGPVPTYLDFMRYNVSAIVQALGEE